MKLEDVLREGSDFQGAVCADLQVEGPLTVSTSCAMTGNDHEIRFVNGDACLNLVGPGPFRFSALSFVHEGSLAPTFVTAQDALVIFSQCRFQGANGGTEEALASAVVARGGSDISFEDCHFEDNDMHLDLGDDSKGELSGCSMRAARADAVRASGRSRLIVDECELVESGWSGLVMSGSCSADLSASRLAGNGCHGLSMAENARLQTHDNRFASNRQHGVLLQGESSLLSRRDHFADNDLCGLDAAESAQVVLSESDGYGNTSHGLQLRGEAACLLRGCRMAENSGSGLALFDSASVTAQRLIAEANALNGVQCGGESRMVLTNATIVGNFSSGLACFGSSRPTVDSSAFHGSLGYGAQVSDGCHFRMADCELGDNRKGGLLFANQASGYVSGSTFVDNGLHGVAVSDAATLSLVENVLQSNQRDGVLLLGQGACQILRNQFLANGRHGLFAATGTRPLLDDNQARDNVGEQILMETDAAKVMRLSSEKIPSLEVPAGVTLTVEGGGSLHLPFQPKPIEESMLLALMKHGRLSEAALGKAAKSRRVGGAMENLIDRLNRAGMPVLRHDGEGPEGNVYALKLDLSRTRQAPGSRTTTASQPLGRQIC